VFPKVQGDSVFQSGCHDLGVFDKVVRKTMAISMAHGLVEDSKTVAPGSPQFEKQNSPAKPA